MRPSDGPDARLVEDRLHTQRNVDLIELLNDALGPPKTLKAKEGQVVKEVSIGGVEEICKEMDIFIPQGDAEFDAGNDLDAQFTTAYDRFVDRSDVIVIRDGNDTEAGCACPPYDFIRRVHSVRVEGM
jgi:hypothetical protein